jgi:hypothetical protein
MFGFDDNFCCMRGNAVFQRRATIIIMREASENAFPLLLDKLSLFLLPKAH